MTELMTGTTRTRPTVGPVELPHRLRRLRFAARELFESAGFPTSDLEEWRHTSIAPIARTQFAAAAPAVVDVSDHVLGEAAAELVFVNGFWRPELSRTDGLPAGAMLLGLREAVDRGVSHAVDLPGTLAAFESRPLVAWNTADFGDGAVVYLPRGAVVQRPIHLLFVSAAADVPAVCHPRVVIVAEENVEAAIVETWTGSAGRSPCLCNAVAEVFVGAGSRMDHYRLQSEAQNAYHMSATAVAVQAGASFVSHSCTDGARISRNELEVFLRGEGASATLNGLVLAGGEQLADNHTLLSHDRPGCFSHELYKHVLDGRATGVFKGKILVQPGAQRTDSRQTSKTLLLSDAATMHSQPALEIYADDVKCTHGSTTGPVDEEAVFYLRSRGLGLEAARHLLTYAFAADITRRIRIEAVRRRIEDDLASRQGLPLDLRITDAGQHDDAAL